MIARKQTVYYDAEGDEIFIEHFGMLELSDRCVFVPNSWLINQIKQGIIIELGDL